MRNAARGLALAILFLAGPAAAAGPLPIVPVQPAPAFHPVAPVPLAIPTGPPLKLADPPTIIAPPAPSPNGIYSVSPPGDDPCNTNVAVVQQSGCD